LLLDCLGYYYSKHWYPEIGWQGKKRY
jgi:hypothetical protein